MATIDDLRDLYSIGLASNGTDGVPIYVVSRDGFQVYMRADDQGMIDRLVNPPIVEAVVESARAVEGPTPLEAIAALDPKTATIADVIEAVQAALA